MEHQTIKNARLFKVGDILVYTGLNAECVVTHVRPHDVYLYSCKFVDQYRYGPFEAIAMESQVRMRVNCPEYLLFF